jgi:dihydrofolate synthase/folylpolyglutamate synthase
MFTSPHISSFRERMQINGQICSLELMIETMEKVIEAEKEHNFDVRFFEVITMIGLLVF